MYSFVSLPSLCALFWFIVVLLNFLVGVGAGGCEAKPCDYTGGSVEFP